MDCPWSRWPHAPAEFCEASLCSWIRQPANTWSNVGFLIVAIAVFRETRDPSRRHLRGLAWIIGLTGIGSAFFHASETLLGSIADYGGMYLGMAWMLMLCARRWFGWHRGAGEALFWTIVIGGLGTMIAWPDGTRWVYLALGVVCGLSEMAMIFHPAMRARHYGWYLAFWAAFVPAVIFWIVDLDGTWCDPQNHVINGHALWHLLNAAGFYAAYRYYLQFDVLRRA